MDTLTARMPNPAVIIPEAMKPIQDLFGSVSGGGVPQATLELVHLRVSQVNGCSACVDGGWRKARKAGESDERLFAVAAWREAPYYSEAAGHYDERGLAALILMIVTTNFFNRLNVSTRQPAEAWG
jgi:AhpD family alkylhydroperoxidase